MTIPYVTNNDHWTGMMLQQCVIIKKKSAVSPVRRSSQCSSDTLEYMHSNARYAFRGDVLRLCPPQPAACFMRSSTLFLLVDTHASARFLQRDYSVWRIFFFPHDVPMKRRRVERCGCALLRSSDAVANSCAPAPRLRQTQARHLGCLNARVHGGTL